MTGEMYRRLVLFPLKTTDTATNYEYNKAIEQEMRDSLPPKNSGRAEYEVWIERWFGNE